MIKPIDVAPRSNRSGPSIELAIERPAAGGRMLARHRGKVILVAGAIPGERVRATVERSERDVAYAAVAEVLEASRDRRRITGDPRCGGHVYGHIAYARQCDLKRQVIADALRRIGGVLLEKPVDVVPSPEHGYRMRARLHVQGLRVGFLREGTHDVCDAAGTGQLLPATVAVLERVRTRLPLIRAARPTAIDVTETLSGDRRAIHVTVAGPYDTAVTHLGELSGVCGLSVGAAADDCPVTVIGDSHVADPFDQLLGGRPCRAGELRRSPRAFFQGNRYILPELVTRVVDAAGPDPVIDLYAGVGLFALTLVATGRNGVTAVEGDPRAAGDLDRNAGAWRGAVRVVHAPVEEYLSGAPRAGTVIVDPPRTGLSRLALDRVVRLGAERLVYVSCDVATFARDLKRLLTAGYSMTYLTAFDLFPNTAHIELVSVLQLVSEPALTSSHERGRRQVSATSDPRNRTTGSARRSEPAPSAEAE